MEKAGADRRGGKCRSKPYGTPTRDYIETALKNTVALVDPANLGHELVEQSRKMCGHNQNKDLVASSQAAS